MNRGKCSHILLTILTTGHAIRYLPTNIEKFMYYLIIGKLLLFAYISGSTLNLAVFHQSGDSYIARYSGSFGEIVKAYGNLFEREKLHGLKVNTLLEYEFFVLPGKMWLEDGELWLGRHGIGV